MWNFKYKLLAIFLFLSIPSFGQTSKTIELSFKEHDFIFDKIDGKTYILSHRYPFKYENTGSAIPYVIIHVLIDGTDSYQGCKTNMYSTTFRKDIIISEAPHSIVRKEGKTYDISLDDTNNPSSHSSHQQVLYSGTHIVDGYKYLSFLVCPFEYDFRNQQLALHKNVILTIDLLKKEKKQDKFGSSMRSIISKLVVNGDEMDKLYPLSYLSNGSQIKSITSQSEDFDYLIITTQAMRVAYQRLAAWKTRKGVRTKVITKEHIDTTFSSLTNTEDHECYPLAFKRAIKYYKDNFNIKYVLLGGDTQFIPSIDAHIDYGNPLSSCSSPCDFYYTCVGSNEGYAFEWSHNPWNGTYGYYENEVDYYPQLMISRLSTKNLADANKQVKRIIEYERNPSVEAWHNEMLMMGCKFDSIYNYTYFVHPQSDVEIKGTNMWNNYLQNLWDSGQRFAFYDTMTSHEDSADYDVTVEHLSEQINKGYPFIHIDSHGGTYDIALENEHLYPSDVMQFENPSYSIIVTSACSTNGFDNDECLSEAFMRNPNGGILGYWGGSRIVPGTTDEREYGPMDLFNLQFYQNLFTDEEPRLGDIAYLTKLHFITSPNMPYSNPFRGIIFSTNLLGDPEMPIYTEAPKKLYYKDIYFDEDEGCLFVDFLEEIPTKVCIMSLHDNGNSLYLVDDFLGEHYTNYGYKLDFLQPNKDYTLCFTRSGYKPYILNVYNSGIVQNDSIANDAVVWSNNVYVGSDVTTQRTYGPVVVEKGDMVIKARSGATIKNDFTLKKGATLTIDPNFIDLTDIPEE